MFDKSGITTYIPGSGNQERSGEGGIVRNKTKTVERAEEFLRRP